MDAWYSSLLPIAFGSAVIPLVAWVLRLAFDHWTLRSLYVSVLPGTGTAPGLDVDSISFSICVRILNASERPLAIERISVIWSGARSALVPRLHELSDDAPLVTELTGPYGDDKQVAVLPVFVAPNGGIVVLRLDTNLAYYGKGKNFRRERLFPNIPSGENERSNFLERLDRGDGIVAVRVGGKMRSLPQLFWKT